MKMFAAMFCAAMVFALAGCSKEDFEKDIIGTWKVTNVTMSETYQGQTHTESAVPEGDNRITFKEDKTFQATTDGEVEASGTWSIKDDKLTFNTTYGEMMGDFETVTVDIDGNSMTFSMSESHDQMRVNIVVSLKKV